MHLSILVFKHSCIPPYLCAPKVDPMIKDIPQPKVEEVALAIVPPETDPDSDLWEVYILNLKDEPIENVLIAAKGYGEMEGKKRRTTTLRHFFPAIGAREGLKIEPITPDVFDLANEYWISFTYEGHMYDKKYVFVKGSIDERYFTTVPLINCQGVMIR